MYIKFRGDGGGRFEVICRHRYSSEASTAENTTDYVSLAFRPFDKFPARILLLFFVIVAVHTFISVSPGSPVSILFLMQL